MRTVSVVELQGILAKEPEATLLDVGTPVEFAAVHLPAARNVPLDELQPGSLTLPREKPVYLLCLGGQRAAKAAEKFERDGFSQPVIVEGGMRAWLAAGLPATHGKTNVISLERQVRIAAGALVLAGFLAGWFLNRWFFLLSGFVGAGLIFAGITDFCGMGLLLARMAWNKSTPRG